MKTQQLFNEIISKGYEAKVVSMFSYAVDKNRRFKQIVILSQPTVELFHIIDSYNAYMKVDVLQTNGQASIVYSVFPNKSTDFDWE